VHAAAPSERAVVPGQQPQYDWDLCITRVSLAALLLFWSLARPTPHGTSLDDGAMGAAETPPAAVVTLPARQSPLNDNGWTAVP
jgi:hypothetical protein